MDFLECKICNIPYDEEDRWPRNAPCGHEWCSVCIDDLIEDSIFLCPKCRQKFKVDVPDDFTYITYYDAQAWELLFHHPGFKKLNQLKLDFIIQNSVCSNKSYYHKGRLNQLECEHCGNFNRKEHTISYSVHRKPYHMFFSSSEYSEPDVVIMYGFTSINNDIHSEISYRNMTYSEDAVLVLTDSTEELLLKGAQAVNASRPVDELIPPILNRGRAFGSHRSTTGHDAGAINDKYYLTCLRRK